LAKGGHGERAEREPITGVWGGVPSAVQGPSPWSWGQGGEAPLKLTLFTSECSMENANSPIFYEIWKRKRPSNIVEFCSFCWKMVGPKGGHCTVSPHKYATDLRLDDMHAGSTQKKPNTAMYENIGKMTTTSNTG